MSFIAQATEQMTPIVSVDDVADDEDEPLAGEGAKAVSQLKRVEFSNSTGTANFAQVSSTTSTFTQLNNGSGFPAPTPYGNFVAPLPLYGYGQAVDTSALDSAIARMEISADFIAGLTDMELDPDKAPAPTTASFEIATIAAALEKLERCQARLMDL